MNAVQALVLSPNQAKPQTSRPTRPLRHVARIVLAAATVLVWTACGNDGPTAPEAGIVRVTVVTTGGDPDQNGYVIGLGAERRPSAVNQILLNDMKAGTHTLTVEGIADNCVLSDTSPRSVVVTGGTTVEVLLTIVCATTGIQITTSTSGAFTPPGYNVIVNSLTSASVGPNDSAIVSRLEPGTHKVTLRVPEECSLLGVREADVVVSNRAVTPVAFEISCGQPIRADKIVFVSGPTYGSLSLSVVHPDGSNIVMLRDGHDPDWSPDRSRLVFSTAYCDFYGYDDCTGGLVIIDPETRVNTPVPNGDGGSQPAWGPSGDRMAFIRQDSGWPEVRGLYTMKLDGTQSVEIHVPGAVYVSSPAWSPDGTRIALVCALATTFPANYDICVINSDGTGFVRLTSDASRDLDPAWSPDGSRISFSTDRGSASFEIWLMAVDGSGVKRLAAGYEAAWSRDGAKLVFARSDGLFTMNVDGSNVSRLTTGQHHSPAWRP